MNKTKEPADSGVMLAPPAQNWALVADTLGEIASLEKRKSKKKLLSNEVDLNDLHSKFRLHLLALR